MRVEFYTDTQTYGKETFPFQNYQDLAMQARRHIDELKKTHKELKKKGVQCRVVGGMGLVYHEETDALLDAMNG